MKVQMGHTRAAVGQSKGPSPDGPIKEMRAGFGSSQMLLLPKTGATW